MSEEFAGYSRAYTTAVPLSVGGLGGVVKKFAAAKFSLLFSQLTMSERNEKKSGSQEIIVYLDDNNNPNDEMTFVEYGADFREK